MTRGAVFAYGTLQFPPIWRAVTGTTGVPHPARLEGHARYRVRNAHYPGIIPDRERGVDGTLYRGIDEATLAMLDRYEGRLYRRVEVRVQLASGERVVAWTYVIPETHRDALADADWDPQDYESAPLSVFTETEDKRSED